MKRRLNELRSSKRLAKSPAVEQKGWIFSPQNTKLGSQHPCLVVSDDALIRDFNGGIGCHVASALEQTLLLPRDMVELRGLRKNEVFLNTKRILGMVWC